MQDAPMKLSPSSQKSTIARRAFTLIELLVVIALIGILAGIIFGALGAARATAQSAAGAQVMRSYGAGIALYIQGKEGKLPTPLDQGQGALYNEETPKQLVVKLADQLEVTKSNKSYLVENMIPPAYPIESLGEDGKMFIMINDVELPGSDGKKFDPWLTGRSDAGKVRRMRDIPEPSSTPVMVDADQEYVKVQASDFANSTPIKPIHVSKRNVLYFDWHVEAVSLEESPGQSDNGRSGN